MTAVLGDFVRRLVSDLVDAGSRNGGLGPLSASERSALSAEVADAFENGNLLVATERLLARAPDRGARSVLARLLDAAVQTMAVSSSSTARAAWVSALQQLQGKVLPPRTSLRYSPVAEAFRGISVPLEGRAAQRLKRLSVLYARLDASLKAAASSADPLAALRALFDNFDPERMPDAALMGLITAFADREAWADVAKVYEASPPALRSLPIPRREYAFALSMLGRSSEARAELEGAIRDGDNSGITFGLLGRLYKNELDELRASGAGPSQIEAALNAAIRAYRQGYEVDRTALYPAVNLPSLLRMRGDPSALAESKRLAEVLRLSATIRASYGERSYWDAAAALEMSCVLGDHAEAQKWLQRIEKGCGSEPWMRASTVGNLKRLAAFEEQEGRAGEPIQAFAEALQEIRGRLASIVAPTVQTASAQTLGLVLKHTYRFGARSPRRITGNYQQQGLAHDISVTPADIIYFRRIVDAEGLAKIEDPLALSKRLDVLIRKHFQTALMEDPNGDRHQDYDRTMRGLASFMGATDGNCQTNVAADWINGLGDCRQHAPTKMLLFEAWKRSRIEMMLTELEAPIPPVRAEELRGALGELCRYEMRILDGEVVNAAGGTLLEEHTMTLLIRRKAVTGSEEMLELDEIHLADSYHHDRYPLGSGKASLAQKDGELWIDVPDQPAAANKVALRPAHYSFDRSFRAIDFGQLRFRGIQVASPGWEHDVPVTGLDLGALHAHVAAPGVAAAAAKMDE